MHKKLWFKGGFYEKTTKKLSIAFCIICFLLINTAVSYAATTVAWNSFSYHLYANNADWESNYVLRTNSTGYNYYTVKITSIESPYTAVRVWVENNLGMNFSSTSTVGTGTTNCSYSVSPAKGGKFKLNMDNPVYTSDTPLVTGKWTPN